VAFFEPLPTDRAELIKRIKKVSFTPTRFRRGYDERAVDDFLDAVIASLAPSRVPLPADYIRNQVFPERGFVGGYSIEQVDDFRRVLADAVQLLH
jgi:DivIVA domain-containing protein